MCRETGICGTVADGTLARLMPVRFLIALAACALLAVPAPAAGQGAGDEQYSDPFGSEQQQQQQQPTPEPAAPPPAATPVPAPAQPAPAAPPAPAPAAPAASPPQLPMTGADGLLQALAGALLLGGGLALRARSGRRT
jgi:LPXTG-motif cell wall-anchored protein